MNFAAIKVPLPSMACCHIGPEAGPTELLSPPSKVAKFGSAANHHWVKPDAKGWADNQLPCPKI
jgi:hypothetical protein